MKSTNNYTLAGGITAAVMRPPNSTLPDELLDLSDQCFTMKLYHEGSSYVETRSCDEGIYTVRHTLTLVGYLGEDLISSDYELQSIMRDGVVADIALCSGAEIRIGWSKKYGTAAPLRLVSCEIISGEKRLDYPMKKWVWESIDTSTLI